MSQDHEWPDMAHTEWNEDGYAVPGTTPVSVVSLGAWGAHNKPMPIVHSAGCAYCDRWAVDFYAAQRVTSDGEPLNQVHRRVEISLIYACDQHLDTAANELCETYGQAINALQMDLPQELGKARR